MSIGTKFLSKMPKRYSFGCDFILSVILLLIFFAVSYVFGLSIFSFPTTSMTSTLIALFGTLLGFVLTALTILFMFDTEKNETLKKIKDAGLYTQIFERYINTTIVFFFSIIVFLIIYIYSIQLPQVDSKIIILNYVVTFLAILSLIRLYHSIRLLKRILDVL